MATRSRQRKHGFVTYTYPTFTQRWNLVCDFQNDFRMRSAERAFRFSDGRIGVAWSDNTMSTVDERYLPDLIRLGLIKP